MAEWGRALEWVVLGLNPAAATSQFRLPRFASVFRRSCMVFIATNKLFYELVGVILVIKLQIE